MNPLDLIEAVRETKLRRLSQRESLAALCTVVSEFVADPANQGVSFPSTTQGLYTRMLLNTPGDDFQIVVVSWSPHSTSPIHDHSGTVGAVAALSGTTIETKHRIVDTDGNVVRLMPSDALRLCGQTVTPILPDEESQVHDMVNATDQWATTVHVYLTPIETFFIYERLPDDRYRMCPRSLWFDVEDAWRLWTKERARQAG